MKNFLIIISLGCVIVAAAPSTSTANDDNGDFNLDPTQVKEKICITEDMREGICVDEGTCSEALNIEIYGIIDESELRGTVKPRPSEDGNRLRPSDVTRQPIPQTNSVYREGFSVGSGITNWIGTCAGEEWCCVHPNMSLFTKGPQTLTPPPPKAACRTGHKDSCPWCVAVYRNNPRKNAPELFCGGTVIGERLVLTAASCADAHRRSDLWVQLPGQTRQYLVNTVVKHKQYSSATREHDVALLLLKEDVEWPGGRQENLGACIGLKTSLAGDCVAIGFDDSDRLKFTPLTVTANSCSKQGSTHDAACGRSIISGSCSVAPGSPVLCPYKSGELIVAGLVRQICMKDSTLLGSLMASAEWISEELTNLTLPANRYTISQ